MIRIIWLALGVYLIQKGLEANIPPKLADNGAHRKHLTTCRNTTYTSVATNISNNVCIVSFDVVGSRNSCKISVYIIMWPETQIQIIAIVAPLKD